MYEDPPYDQKTICFLCSGEIVKRSDFLHGAYKIKKNQNEIEDKTEE